MAKRKRGAKGRPLGHRSNGRGSLVMDVTVAGIPIRRATGTTDPRQYQLYRGMVEQLGAAGRLDILRQLADRTVSFAEVWDVVRPQTDRPVNLNRLPTPETMRALGPALTQWTKATRVASTTLRARMRDVRHLTDHAPSRATVLDLPAAVVAWRATCEARETPRTYNMARVTALAFARATLGRTHPLYAALLEIPTLPEASEAGRPLEPDALTDWLAVLRATMPAHYAAEFLSMCVSGMRPIEYWGGQWTETADAIVIPTAKQTGTLRAPVRLVPRVAPLFVPPGTYGTWLHEMQRKGLHVHHGAYDARRTFAHAVEAVGIPDSRLRYYMGHGIRRVTDRYTRHEVRPHLQDDAAKLRAWFGLPDATGGLTLVREA